MESAPLLLSAALPPEQKAYLRTALLLQGLFHDIRTPLSVISNELSYLGADAEQPLGLRRCREIAAILRRLQAPPFAAPQLIALDRCLGALGLPLPAASAGALISADLDTLRYCFDLIAQLLPGAQPSAAVSDDRGMLRLHYRRPSAGAAREACRAASFTDYFCLQRGLNAVFAPLIDAALELHGAQAAIEAGAELNVSIDLPLQ